MFDARPSHDLIIIDDPVEEVRPARSRVPTVELTMQVKLLGEWHRRMPDLSATACGVPYHSEFGSLRREVLTENLCPQCFTPFELKKAADHRARERAITIPLIPIPEEKP